MRRPAGIRLDAVTQHYRTPSGLIRAVDGVTLDVEPGSSLAITGRSGCGKSTLLGLIGGLETPSAGRVTVGDLELSTLSERERDRLRREHFGFVFQSDNLLPYLTAIENVSLQVALHRSAGAARSARTASSAGTARAARSAEAAEGAGRCRDLLTELGLEDCVDKLPDQLSGGQRLRVAIARAVVHHPGVILADEPTGSVDADNAAVILNLLLAAQRATGATLVVVTHDPDVASRLERTVNMRDGRMSEPEPDPRSRVG